MTDIVLPEALRDVEPVRSIRTPARLDYRFTAGAGDLALPAGHRRRRRSSASAAACAARSCCRRAARARPTACPPPSRSSCPTGASSPRSAWSTSSSRARPWSCPTSAPRSCPTAPTWGCSASCRRSRSTRSAWACASRRSGSTTTSSSPTSRRSSGGSRRASPTRDYEQLQGARLMRDVAVVAFAQSHHVRREQQRNEVEMVMPVLHQVKADAGLDQSQIDFTCSGSTDYLAGSAFSFVMTLDGVGAVAADQREPRRDGRRLGAVRGVGQDPDGGGRHRARLRLRQVVARRPARRC